MSHKVHFVYMDGKDLTVFLKDNEVKRFMESIGKSEVYFDDEAGKGMWIPIDRIRYFQVERELDPGQGLNRVPSGNAGDSRKEAPHSEDGSGSVEQAVCPPETEQAQDGDGLSC